MKTANLPTFVNFGNAKKSAICVSFENKKFELMFTRRAKA